jgi:hypothetical protein
LRHFCNKQARWNTRGSLGVGESAAGILRGPFRLGAAERSVSFSTLVVGICLESQSQLHGVDSMSVVCSCQVRLFVWCSESLAGSAEGELLQACKAKQGLQTARFGCAREVDRQRPTASIPSCVCAWRAVVLENRKN